MPAAFTFVAKPSLTPLKVLSGPPRAPKPSPSGKLPWRDSVQPATYVCPLPSTAMLVAESSLPPPM